MGWLGETCFRQVDSTMALMAKAAPLSRWQEVQ
jgi:hypothetical protein